MTRYSDIRRGAQLNAALQAYVNYLSTPRVPNVGGGTARGPQTTLYLTPFGQDLDANTRVSAKANTDSYGALQTYVVTGNGAEAVTTLGTDTLVELKKFRAARIVWFRNTARTVQVATSNVTNQRYLKYNGDRDSCPFGRATETDDQMDVFNAMKADILAQNNTLLINRVSLTREKIGV